MKIEYKFPEVKRNPDCQSCVHCRIKFKVENGQFISGREGILSISCRKGMWLNGDGLERKFKTLTPLGTGANLPEWCDNYEGMDD